MLPILPEKPLNIEKPSGLQWWTLVVLNSNTYLKIQILSLAINTDIVFLEMTAPLPIWGKIPAKYPSLYNWILCQVKVVSVKKNWQLKNCIFFTTTIILACAAEVLYGYLHLFTQNITKLCTQGSEFHKVSNCCSFIKNILKWSNFFLLSMWLWRIQWWLLYSLVPLLSCAKTVAVLPPIVFAPSLQMLTQWEKQILS